MRATLDNYSITQGDLTYTIQSLLVLDPEELAILPVSVDTTGRAGETLTGAAVTVTLENDESFLDLDLVV
jgi:hypothetical protein